MGFSDVYQSLTEIFPQVDSRILRAVAIEHPLDADEAAAIILSDIVPSLPSNTSCAAPATYVMTPPYINTPPWYMSTDNMSKRQERGFGDVVSRSHAPRVSPGSQSSASSSSGTTPLVFGRVPDTSASSSKIKLKKVPLFSERRLYPKDLKAGSKSSPFSSFRTIPMDVRRGTNAYTTFGSDRNQPPNLPLQFGRGACHKDVASEPLGKASGKEHVNFDFFGKCSDVPSEGSIGLHVPQDDLSSVVSAIPHDNVKFGSDFWQDLDHMTWNQEESITSICSENTAPKLVDLIPGDNVATVQQDSSLEVGAGTINVVDKTSNGLFTGENGDTELGIGSTNVVDKSSKDLLASENGETELETVSANVVDKASNDSLASENGNTDLGCALNSSSTQGCSVDHLEEIVEDAKTNKKTFHTVMDSVMNLMKEVELQEEDAEKSKVEAARGGLDTLEKVEELKKMLEHAKEANDMNAGDVYGEKSILATEVRELENRLLNLSEERNKSLSVLDEMRGTLEIRLAAALEMKKVAEQEKKEKEDSARQALAEQEAHMEKVVQESKLLKQQAEENSKLREFLMDRGQIVDSLQGEISVICQDVKLLKEKFDNRGSLTNSFSSSQSSYVSYMRRLDLDKSTKEFNEMLETSSNNMIPETAKSETSSDNKSLEASMNEEEKKDERRELLENGWEWDLIN